MPGTIRKDFDTLSPRTRRRVLEILENEEVKGFDNLLITGIQSATGGSEAGSRHGRSDGEFTD